MINLDHIQNVRNRIAAIEQQFGISNHMHGARFGQVLEQKMKDKIPQKASGAEAVAETQAPAAAAATPETARKSPVGDTVKVLRSLSDLPVANGKVAQLVEEAARKYQVDPKLVSAVAEVESGGSQDAISDAGAIGVMQLMPDTAASLGVDPFDEKQNIEGGAKYLRQMLDSFGGDVKKAVAAYNAGPQAVKDYGGVPPYSETQDYVNKVLDIYR